MKQANTTIQVKQVVITSSGACLFLGNSQKIFMIYVDIIMGEQIRFLFNKKTQSRPLTSDFIRYLCLSFDISIQTLVLYHADKGTFYAKAVCRQAGPVTRIVELDIRPSDAIMLSLSFNKPLTIDTQLFESLSDASELLENFSKTEQS
ncbi:MAG: bifunctional nuclease family protein [Opitutales bacterium]|nr:bifunctional nuclease family protein [Opitutales bacterium]